jgi:tRNA (guanine37-N1)-methyltransferase
MNFHIITLFAESFDSYINESILARAQKEKKIKISFYNPRDFVPVPKSQKGKEKPYLRLDDRPFGGGPGMVMQAVPMMKAIEKALRQAQGGRRQKNKAKIIFLSPSGKQFDTEYAKTAAKKYTDIIIICGRYEGIDARIKKVFKMEDVSIGPFVLTGGELPAMIIIDCMARQIEGVLGNFDSLEESRIASNDVYTRPEVIEYKGKKYRVPKVLLSGNHKKIEEWKQKSK